MFNKKVNLRTSIEKSSKCDRIPSNKWLIQNTHLDATYVETLVKNRLGRDIM